MLSRLAAELSLPVVERIDAYVVLAAPFLFGKGTMVALGHDGCPELRPDIGCYLTYGDLLKIV